MQYEASVWGGGRWYSHRTGKAACCLLLPILHDTSCTGGTKFNVIGRECCDNAETGDRRSAVCNNTALSAAPADYADSEDHSLECQWCWHKVHGAKRCLDTNYNQWMNETSDSTTMTDVLEVAGAPGVGSGRHVLACTRLAPGQVVMVEAALVTGPRLSARLVCAGCLQCLQPAQWEPCSRSLRSVW